MLVVFIGLHGDDEWRLVLRSAPGLAAVAFPAQVGIVDLHEALQFPGFLAFAHGPHDLVLHSPGGLVVDA